MISSISSSLSAIKSYGQKMDVTANNVANANSDEFKKSAAYLKEGYNGGVEVDIKKIESKGPLYSEANSMKLKEGSNVDLAEEIPQMMVSQRGYEANLKTLKTQDEMVGTVLNIVT
ncbi:MAG: hypothetical protein HQK79_06865 [Desulfobacterales bacterium]|nr:hypothetical protein [Desulfobacterales bacterium]